MTRCAGLPLIALCVVACNNQPTPVATKKVVQPPPSVADLKAASHRSLYARFIKHPTGKNGFEDYLKGVDALSAPEASSAWYAEQNKSRSNGKATPSDTAWAKDASLIDLQRNLRDKTKDAFTFFKAGNEKPFLPTASHDLMKEVAFSVTSYFNRAVNEACAVSEAEFVDGESSAATDLLVNQIEFLNRTGSLDVISNLSANISMNTVLRKFDEHMKDLKDADCALIDSRIAALLKGPPKLASAFEINPKTQLSLLNRVIDEGVKSKPKDLSSLSGDALEFALRDNEIRALTPAQQKALPGQVARRLLDVYAAEAKRLSLPEAQWRKETEPFTPAPNKVIDDLTRESLPFPAIALNEARTRTQLRILRLRALIESYRLKNSRLPSSLADLSTPDATADPYAASQFNYTVSGDTYNVSSAMTDKGFPIEMVRRLPSKK